MFQVRGKKILAEEPQPPGASWAGNVPGTGTGSLSTGLGGGLDLPWGARERPPAPRASTPPSRKSPGWIWGGLGSAHARLRGAGWPLTSSPSGLLGHAGAPARTCKHPRARSRALKPQPEPLIPPYRPHRAEPARPGMFAPRLGAELRPQVPRSPAPGCQQYLQINPPPPASTNSELPARSAGAGAGRGRTPTRSRLGQAGPGAEKPRQPQPTSARPHAAPRASGSHRGVR